MMKYGKIFGTIGRKAMPPTTICEHDFVVKDGASQNETYKIAVCSKCLHIGKILARNEKPEKPSVWDVKDRRITRMSVLKVASDLYLADRTSDIYKTAQELEAWVYREDI